METIVATEAEQKQTPAWLLELYGGEPERHQKIVVAGVEWWYWRGCSWADINCHIEDDDGRLRMIGCYQDDKGAFVWNFSLLVAEGQYVRAYGKAGTLLQAAEAALSYAPEELECGGAVWFREQSEAEQWKGWVNGDCVQIRVIEKAYRWERKCAEAEDLLKLCNSFGNELSGEAATREEAMQAAIDAPDKLRELAAKFVTGKPIEEAYVRGVEVGREEMRVAAHSVASTVGRDINRIRLLPAGMAKEKAA